MATFFLAMQLYPEIQRKAQKELDAVIGTERLPNMQDMSRLPYIRCVVKEVLRWIPAVPLGKSRPSIIHMPPVLSSIQLKLTRSSPAGIPHASIDEDVYRGYRIPAGSIV